MEELKMLMQVFFEETWANSIVPFASSATFDAMKLFGGHNMHLAAIVATAGATLGMTFNWLLGHLMLRLHHTSKLHLSEKNYARASQIFNKYGIFLIVLSWVPLCKFFLLVAGFLGSKLKFVLPLVVAGQLFYYINAIL